MIIYWVGKKKKGIITFDLMATKKETIRKEKKRKETIGGCGLIEEEKCKNEWMGGRWKAKKWDEKCASCN